MEKGGLLPRVLTAIVLGIALGLCMPMGLVRVFETFNGVFGQLLKFLIPLIIIGLVTPAIGEIGRQAGRLLLITVVIAYADTVMSALLAYGTGSMFFPRLVDEVTLSTGVSSTAETIAPYFQLNIPPLFDVMASLG